MSLSCECVLLVDVLVVEEEYQELKLVVGGAKGH